MTQVDYCSTFDWLNAFKRMKSFLLCIIGAILSCPFVLVVDAKEDYKSSSSLMVDDSSSVALTRDNFEKVTLDKTVFVKFFAPWCSHCAELQPEWEQLAVEFQNHHVTLVASVDCSAHPPRTLCEQDFNIQGLPTLLYGDASQGGVYLHEYRGDKSYRALSAFTNEHLTRPMCSPANVNACDPEMKTRMETILQLDKSQLEQAIQEAEHEIQQAEIVFQEIFQNMQTRYDQVAADHASKEARIKANMKMIQAVIQTKTNDL
jgi:thioredoxin-like negative regulator of GroEL